MYMSRQWTIGPPALEIWWSCQISGGPDVADYIFLAKIKHSWQNLLAPVQDFWKDLQYIHFIENDLTLVNKVFVNI